MSSIADRIARRVVPHLRDGEVVNLGVGLPTRVADLLGDDGPAVTLQTENGMLGVGPTALPGEEDPNRVNAGKVPVTELPGASYCSSSESFAMIRGGHVDVAVLGALQVDRNGLVANWSVPGSAILGVGGAMDLMTGARRVIVATTHRTKAGASKLVHATTLPVTSRQRADVVVTELATFAVDVHGLLLTDVAPESSLEEVRAATDAFFRVAPGLGLPDRDGADVVDRRI